ncbi:MAG: SGNH/GDSL hydrolase family protein [Phaeodactylibacter sp.]|uniref:SGNH/GDSL hydrolase family protein n=1 Tax=Phaeodactylibacter sp. TaxID=1940289 RepID=UPI0032EEA849
MKYNWLIGILLLLWSCSPSVENTDAPAPVQPAPEREPYTEDRLPDVKPHGGWIVCGGSWTAGQGADLGTGYADQLGERVVNAGISREPLPGLLQRLPLLLERGPEGLILEIGHDDEALEAPLEAFREHLNSLGQLLSAHPGLQLLIVVSATDPAYRQAVTAFAERQGAPTLNSDHFFHPPSSQSHLALARQIREMLYE